MNQRDLGGQIRRYEYLAKRHSEPGGNKVAADLCERFVKLLTQLEATLAPRLIEEAPRDGSYFDVWVMDAVSKERYRIPEVRFVKWSQDKDFVLRTAMGGNAITDGEVVYAWSPIQEAPLPSMDGGEK